MNPSRAVAVILLAFLSGCGGCQHGDEVGGPGTGGAASGAGAAATPTAAPLQARGKIQPAPMSPAPGGPAAGTPQTPLQANVGATPMQPRGGPEPGEAGAPPAGADENEGDCIVVADADPDYGPPPLAVTFSAEAECNAGQPTYKWNFGDGSAPSSEVNPTHTYARPGDYTASVTITGPGGSTASDEVDITVQEGEGEPPQE